MKILIGGTVALIIGFLGLVFWWFEFLIVLKGVVPSFSSWGALAIYLGIEIPRPQPLPRLARRRKNRFFPRDFKKKRPFLSCRKERTPLI